MPYVQRDWITNVSFFIQFLYILASCHGIKVQQGNLYSSQKRQEHIAGTLPAAYEIVEPVKVDENGAFLSHSLFHNVKSKRRKRDLNSQRVHYRILYKTEELLFNMTVHDGFLSDDYILERRAGKLSSVKITPRSGSNCHLVGTVQQQDTGSGFAAISACQGLTGFFRLSHGDYFIEPFQNSSQSAGRQQKHIIYKRESQNPRRNRRDLPMSKYQACGVNDDQSSALKQERQREKWEREYQTGRKITQRSVSKERWVETLVVADTKMIQYHGSENVESYIFTIMNMVTGLFHDASIGNAVHIKVVRLILLEEEEEGLKIVHHADQTLASFCKWQKSINPKSDAHPAHHDIAVLLTRKDICVGRNSPCETLGLSYLSGMCQPHRSCNINEDSGLPVAFTIAHEIGHSFGIHHDGQGNDCELIGQPFIMSRQLKYDTSPLTWSPCSKEDITRFLDRGWGFCLDDVPVKKDVKPPFVAPGVLYDLNHQCQLQYGPNATVCELVDNVCQTLWCLVHDSCRSKLDAAVDGTRCAENKWCFNGKCILVGRHPESIHGGWGTWSAWSHCTRTCGAGVQSAERKCNNPEPKYGGKYCTGERKRYRLCKTFPCPNTGPSFRQMQCSEFDTVPYKNELYQWIPIYNTENPCALHCRPTDANFADKLLDAVIDGTPCFDGNNSKDVCINGMCKSVGCDHEINSNATEDRCGVCLGDGSTCQTIKKEFNQSEGFGYVDVGNIPKGARDIKIEEIKAAGNFLSLRSEDPEKYYLNGGFTIQWNGDYKVAGTTFHYQRNGDLENLTASGPTNESVWIQLLFQESNPGIKYEYVIQKDQGNETESTYSWEYGRWTDCSATCGTGAQRQVAQCVNKQRGVVITTFCDQDLQPVSRQKKCHIQDCPPRWWVGEWQQCSSTCGPTGEKKRAVLCIRTVGTDEQALPSEDCHHLTKPKGYISCNRDILCPSDWTVSNWSECSITCGGGVRTRNVTCSKNNDEPCEASKKPNSKALCGLQQCPLQKNLPPGPIKHKYGKKIIKVIPKKSGIPTKRIIFRKVIRKYHPVTKIPKSLTTSAPKMILPPVVNSIKEDFQINDIPNSTHFNVDYKYNFVLVENNKRKINSTKPVPTVSTGGEHYGETDMENKTENYFLSTTTAIPQNITSANDFLTEEPETQTASEEINGPDDETNSYGDTENSIIESRSKRHKGRANVIQYNQSTITYPSESPTPNSNLVTTESPQTFNIKVFISLVGTEQNATLSEKNLASPAANTSEELDNLQVTIVNISEDSSKKLNNTTLGGLLNSAPHINITDLVFNVSEKVYWIIGNWSECSTTCGLGAEWRSVVCSTSSEADCQHIKKPDPARKCHLRPCASWRTGNWSKCSTNCGGGFRTREVHCMDIRENRPLRPFHCQSHGPNPQQNSSCNQEPCLSWLAKPWSECSKTCGSGSRQRQVICPLENRCDLKKSPVITINCSEKPCVRWKPDAWSECSVSCGEGIQQRIVECMNVDNNSTMNNTLCEETEPKPRDTQICTNQDCKNIDPLCKKDKMSINFCKTVKSIGKCSLKNIEKECCFTCMQPETRLPGG
ncbi:A disintegrin and metalloproteinase with thrombospondin motifs 12 [Spea bombifrons]|uniref:A disintegrin and metalloproteinase with thrombospondin motifs 12 n=1 Tax=Spea bombifrons TaxID=233779 RepID=UPI00234BC0FB|nr:A disintegrin and metalloproteinase with thrombospondin motifs 12 [Spea bombifrons]